MILNSREKTAWSYRTLRDCPPPAEANVDVTLFANYHGTVKDSHSFNDPALYTFENWFTRFLRELGEIRLFRRNKKHAKNS